MIGRLGARHADAKKRLEAIEKNAPEPFEQDNLTGSESKILQQHHRSWYRIFSLQKWRPVVWAGVSTSAMVLAANLIILFTSLDKKTDGDGIRILFQGDCTTSSRISTIWHILINILSTLLLGASNAASQILVAPTRHEVDTVHSKSQWMHIGVLDFQNLRFIARKRTFLCFLLATSSIPLHLLYNSTVFDRTSIYDYYAFMVTPDFVTGGNYSVEAAVNSEYGTTDLPQGSFKSNTSDSLAGLKPLPPNFDRDVLTIQQEAQNGKLTRLSWQECATQFAQDLMSNYSAVLLVSRTNPNSSNSFWSSYKYYTPSEMSSSISGLQPYSWICNGTANCNVQQITNSGSWSIRRTQGVKNASFPTSFIGPTTTIDHCLVRSESPDCAVDLSIDLMIVVIVCNFVKLVGFLACLSIKDHKPLVTVGDAVCSFLAHPDRCTVGIGPMSSRDARKGEYEIHVEATSIARKRVAGKPLMFPGRLWEGRRYKYFSAANIDRWIWTGVVSIMIWLTGLMLLLLTGCDFSTGFGLNPQNVVASGFSLPTSILTANVMQLAVSSAYLLLNGILTACLLSSELMDYATQAKTMRVTRPQAAQRSTYWLQLPYRWSIPLMMAMTLLHWLISEALFMVDMQVLDPNGNKMYGDSSESGTSFYGIGYSAMPALCAVIEGFLIIVLFFAQGFRRFPANMPVLSSCSIAISAACHPLSHEPDDAVLRPLRYGVLETTSVEEPKPAGFSARDVGTLKSGEIYGGGIDIEEDDDDDAALESPLVNKAPLSSRERGPDGHRTTSYARSALGSLSSEAGKVTRMRHESQRRRNVEAA